MAYYLDSFAGASFVQSLPPILALVLFAKAGWVVDQSCHRKILVRSDHLASLCLVVMAIGFVSFSWSTSFAWVLIGIGYMVYQASLLFFNPAAEALLSQIVVEDQRTQAHSRHRGTLQVAAVTGQFLSGFLYTFLGPVTLLLLNALSVLTSARLQKKLPATFSSSKARQTSLAGWPGSQRFLGLRYIWNHSTLRQLMFFTMTANAFIAPAFLVLPFHFKGGLGASEGVFGLALGLFTLGQALGSFALTPRLKNFSPGSSILLCTWALALGLYALTWVGGAYGALALVFLMGLSIAPIQILTLAEMQKVTESQYMGRVMSALMAASQVLTPVFSLVSALLLEASYIQAPEALKISAAVLVLSSTGFLWGQLKWPAKGWSSKSAGERGLAFGVEHRGRR